MADSNEVLETKIDILIEDFQRSEIHNRKDSKEILEVLRNNSESIVEIQDTIKWHKIIASTVFALLLSFNIYVLDYARSLEKEINTHYIQQIRSERK